MGHIWTNTDDLWKHKWQERKKNLLNFTQGNDHLKRTHFRCPTLLGSNKAGNEHTFLSASNEVVRLGIKGASEVIVTHAWEEISWRPSSAQISVQTINLSFKLDKRTLSNCTSFAQNTPSLKLSWARACQLSCPSRPVVVLPPTSEFWHI